MVDEAKRAKNQEILDSYDGTDVTCPQIILRRVAQVDGDVLDDDLDKITLNLSQPDWEQIILGSQKQWAASSLKKIRQQYIRMLNDPFERIHLEAIKESGCRLFLEDKESVTTGNLKSGGYGGISTRILDKPAICLVANSFGDTTLLHEAIHNSDLRLSRGSFSSLPLHQAAIMMIDAQKIVPWQNFETTKACRKINKYYISGEIYEEGLAWITQKPLESLSKEKNHIGKNLKILHSVYTEAILNKQNAILDCFKQWRPSEHIYQLLRTYNSKHQIIGTQREKILRQQKHFWDELVKFRKALNKIKIEGKANTDIPAFLKDCCWNYEFPIAPAYLAYIKAEKMFDEMPNNQKLHVIRLKELFNDILPETLNNSSSFTEKFFKCYSFLSKIKPVSSDEHFSPSWFPNLFESQCFNQNNIVSRTSAYEHLEIKVKICEMETYSGCSEAECTLAHIFNLSPKTVNETYLNVEQKFKSLNSMEERRLYTESVLNKLVSAQNLLVDHTTTITKEDCSTNQSKQLIARYQLELALSMSLLLARYHLGLYSDYAPKELYQPDNIAFSQKILNDLKYVSNHIERGADKLKTKDYFQRFPFGVVGDLCSRAPSSFNKNSPDYKPDRYSSCEERSLYFLLKTRHFYQKQTHCKVFPEELLLSNFNADTNYRYLFKKYEKQFSQQVPTTHSLEK